MNKTVNINISGIVFHIEEDAYNKLHSYLTTIKSYFSESEGRDEIMTDIENRIAEVLSERINNTKQVVLMADVDHIIEVMGKPEDFAGEQNAGDKKKYEQYNHNTKGKRKRVFRDPDNKILSGVCSGIANYFNIDPLWLRLAFAIAFFAFGSGFLLYFILWIVIPEAKTTAEKLEMHGEDINFSNIGKKVEEELHSFGKKAEQWGEGVKQQAQSGKIRDFIDNLLHLLSSILGGGFRVVIKLVGLFITIVGLVLIIAIMSSFFGGTGLLHLEGETFSIREAFGMLFENPQQELMAGITILLFAGVPLIMMVFGGIKLLLGIRKKNRFINVGAGILWLTGVIMVIMMANQIAGEFSEDASSKNVIPITQPKNNLLVLKLSVEPSMDYSYERRHLGRFLHLRLKNRNIFSIDSANLNFGFPDLNIVKSETDSFEIVVYAEANGKSRKEAFHFAKNVLYNIIQKDSVIEFMPYFSVPKSEKWRDQQVHIEVRVPKGKMVYISRNMKDIIYDIDNETDTWDGDMVGRRWIMGTEELRCMDCDGLDVKENKKRKRNIEINISSDESTLNEDTE